LRPSATAVTHSANRQQQVLAQFGVTWAIVEQIEQEGMNNEWSPLDEPD
jgi:hypothetical protein